MSLNAVEWEHFVIFAHFSAVSFPEKPSMMRRSIFFSLSLSGIFLSLSQIAVLERVALSDSSDDDTTDEAEEIVVEEISDDGDN